MTKMTAPVILIMMMETTNQNKMTMTAMMMTEPTITMVVKNEIKAAIEIIKESSTIATVKKGNRIDFAKKCGRNM